MSRFFSLLLCVVLSGCFTKEKTPEPFAREVTAAIAAGDFSQYWKLSAQTMNALAQSDSRILGQGLGGSLSSQEEKKAYAEFERVVRTGRLRPGDAARLEPIVVATELERWTLELFEPDGRGVGIQIAVRSWKDGFRLLRAYPVQPGRERPTATES